MKIVLVHGNGGGTGEDNWFPEVKRELEKLGHQALSPTFPDNQVAHENIWLPYLKDELKADENTILIGHSSGGVAALRYAEQHKILGSVIVSANYTDLGDATEKASGYYAHPWDWEKIKANQKWILQFASTDDPYIPIAEARFIHERVGSEYFEFTDRGHFMMPSFPQLIQKLVAKKHNF